MYSRAFLESSRHLAPLMSFALTCSLQAVREHPAGHCMSWSRQHSVPAGVGARLGTTVGSWLGSAVGLADGLALGADDGTLLGSTDGVSVGSSVGSILGAKDGGGQACGITPPQFWAKSSGGQPAQVQSVHFLFRILPAVPRQLVGHEVSGVGFAVGRMVGAVVGVAVGGSVGEAVGTTLGTRLGRPDGDNVGNPPQSGWQKP